MNFGDFLSTFFIWKLHGNVIVTQLVKHFLCLLWCLKAHCCVHKRQPLDPVLRQTNPGHSLKPHFFNNRFSIIFWICLKVFWLKCCGYVLPISFFMISWPQLFDEEYKLWTFSLRTFICLPVTSSLLGLRAKNISRSFVNESKPDIYGCMDGFVWWRIKHCTDHIAAVIVQLASVNPCMYMVWKK
jgi:hypothetical protein